METIAVQIDGRTLEGVKGQTVLELALANGIEIPNLCYDPRLTPAGACRLCLVEIEGQRGFQTACTREIEPGMVIKTRTDEILRLRKTTLELLMSEHGARCITCDDDGECRLQKYAYEYGIDPERFRSILPKRRIRNFTQDSRAILYNPAKCIRCGRCVRMCAEVQQDHALVMSGRALDVAVTTAFDLPLHETTCELCGNCVLACPTGALYEVAAKGRGQTKDLVKVRTTCPYCGVGCQMDLNVDRASNRIVRVTADPDVIPNHGVLCVKGHFALEFVDHDERLRTPLVRRNGGFEPVSWEEAIRIVADRFGHIRKESGPDALAGLSSAKCTNEDNFVFQKFMRACIGTNNVDHCARLCHASTVAGLAAAFGSGAMTNSIEELRRAPCIFVIGSNTTEAHPVIGIAIKQAVSKRGARLIVADPRRIDLVPFARLHLQHRNGSDVALINAMMHVILEEGLEDRGFIQERTEGFEELADMLASYAPEKMASVTGVPAEDIRAAARMYAKAEAASIVYSMGITQHTTGTENVLSLANLALLTGNVGRECGGVNPLRGQNNVQGACDVGALPNVYPGYQRVTDPEIRKKFEHAWGTALSPEVGLTVVEMMHAAEEGRVRGLYIMGENPALSDPNLNRTRKALERVEFLVVQDIFLTETARYADVVLPSVCFAEKDGTFTNTERRVQRVRKAVDPPGEARVDWEIVCDIARAMGYPMEYRQASEIMDETARLAPIYGGIRYDRIGKVGLQWPCGDMDHPGTPYLHKDGFPRGRGKFTPVPYLDPAEMPDEEYPFLLSTGRLLYQFHTGTMTRKSPEIQQVSPMGYVEIHPGAAASLGISDGDTVEVASRRGSVQTRARLTERVDRGSIFMPFHFSEGPANILTNDALDPVAKIPEFKVCAARVQKAAPAS